MMHITPLYIAVLAFTAFLHLAGALPAAHHHGRQQLSLNNLRALSSYIEEHPDKEDVMPILQLIAEGKPGTSGHDFVPVSQESGGSKSQVVEEAASKDSQEFTHGGGNQGSIHEDDAVADLLPLFELIQARGLDEAILREMRNPVTHKGMRLLSAYAKAHPEPPKPEPTKEGTGHDLFPALFELLMGEEEETSHQVDPDDVIKESQSAESQEDNSEEKEKSPDVPVVAPFYEMVRRGQLQQQQQQQQRSSSKTDLDDATVQRLLQELESYL